MSMEWKKKQKILGKYDMDKLKTRKQYGHIKKQLKIS